MMKATGSGGISGGGSSIGSGGASLARGSTKVGGQNIDDYVEELIVGTLRADKIWSRIGKINGLNVGNLYVSENADLDCGVSIDHFNLGGNPLSDVIKEIWDAIRALQNAPKS